MSLLSKKIPDVFAEKNATIEDVKNFIIEHLPAEITKEQIFVSKRIFDIYTKFISGILPITDENQLEAIRSGTIGSHPEGYDYVTMYSLKPELREKLLEMFTLPVDIIIKDGNDEGKLVRWRMPKIYIGINNETEDIEICLMNKVQSGVIKPRLNEDEFFFNMRKQSFKMNFQNIFMVLSNVYNIRPNVYKVLQKYMAEPDIYGVDRQYDAQVGVSTSEALDNFPLLLRKGSFLFNYTMTPYMINFNN